MVFLLIWADLACKNTAHISGIQCIFAKVVGLLKLYYEAGAFKSENNLVAKAGQTEGFSECPFYTPFYRLAHLLADLGWVDLDFGCSITLLGQYIDTVAAHQPGNFSHLSQPNPGPRGDGPPCISCLEYTTMISILDFELVTRESAKFREYRSLNPVATQEMEAK